MYATGDMARFGHDRNIEFLGRRDNQVKVRGYRIELGEIEAALGEHPSVREAVVVAQALGEGEKRLIAFVVGEREGEAGAEEMRKHLREKVPDYMVPSFIVMVEEMPLNASGKVDRRALESLQHLTRDKGFIAPRTETEHALAALWSELLKIEKICVYDDFFDSGGHSLLATQLVSRVKRNFGVELSLVDIFAHPTIESLAGRVEEALVEASATDRVDQLLDLLESLGDNDAETLLARHQATSEGLAG
jgi:hypothetical protein